MKIIVGVLLTPIITALTFIGVPVVIEGELMKPHEMLILSVPAYIVTLGGLIFVGLSISCYLKQHQILNVRWLSVCGAFGGLTLGLVTALSFGTVSGITMRSKSTAKNAAL